MTNRAKPGTREIFLTALLVAAGCGGDGGGGEAGGGGAQPAASPVDPATAGHVSIAVTFAGDAPAMPEIDMADEPTCAAKHSGTPAAETVVVGPNGGLANVFVYVKEGLGDLSFPAPSEPAAIDQDGCVYHPHVLGLQVGQALTIRNSDGLLHNINASPSANRPFNVSQPVNMDTERSFRAPEVMIPVRCDVHGWMSAYIGVLDHPYFAVSGPDGSVSLDGLPPGEYTVEAWHERYGTQTRTVTVTTGETAELAFEFTPETAGLPVPLGEVFDPFHPGGHRAVDQPPIDRQ